MSQTQIQENQTEVIKLKKWIIEEQLPEDLDDKQLLRFLHSCYYDEEKTKCAIKLFYSIRASSPDLLTDRDPLSPEIQKIMSVVNLALLHISGNRNLWVMRINDPGLNNYDYIQGVKLFLLHSDTWLLKNDVLEEEDIIILDVKDINLKMLTMINMSVANRFNRYQQEALPIRLKQIHVLNVSPIFNKCFSVLKHLIKKEVKEKINFHQPESDTILNFLSKEDLPEEFGGTNGKLVDHTKTIISGIVKNRESLMKVGLWSASDRKSLKIESADTNESFKQLEFD